MAANPPRQQNLELAIKLGFQAIRAQPADQMAWLGAESLGGIWRLPVLGDTLDIDPAADGVATRLGRSVSPHWAILALHYLATTSRPESLRPEVTFADLPLARSYVGVYDARTVGRLCATVGREAEQLRTAATALGGRSVAAGDAAFDFDVFPRLALRLIWHAPDDEFPPSATLLLPRNIDAYFSAEDVVVLSERLISRLAGKPL